MHSLLDRSARLFLTPSFQRGHLGSEQLQGSADGVFDDVIDTGWLVKCRQTVDHSGGAGDANNKGAVLHI